jgi:hypothetical protein
VKSLCGTQFRIRANRVLKDYLIKGYAVKDRMRRENYDDLRRLAQVFDRTSAFAADSNKRKITVIFSCRNIPNGMCCHRGKHVSTELQSLTGFRKDGK